MKIDNCYEDNFETIFLGFSLLVTFFLRIIFNVYFNVLFGKTKKPRQYES